MQKGFEYMEKRFEQVDKRFESSEARFNRITAVITVEFFVLGTLVTLYRFIN